MFNLKRMAISMGLVTLLSWYGGTHAGGDGFLPDKSQSPVGFTSGNLITALILGGLIGLIPWRKSWNLIVKMFQRK